MLTHFSITQQGEHHIERGDPCQDYSTSCRLHLNRLNCDLVLAAIADGVGSCMFSQYGAETAVTGFLSCMTHNLGKDSFDLTDEAIRNLFEHSFRYALSRVAAQAKEMELPFMEFDSTLTGVLFDGSNLWFGHVGDDGIVVLYTDGTYEMITERHEGNEPGELFPLSREEKWQFEKAPKAVASLVLMTDGVLNYCVDGKAMKNRIWLPFLEPALTTPLETDEQAETQKQEWEVYLMGSPEDKNNFRNYVTDDISFVLVENSEAVAALPAIVFDQEKWDADTQKRRQELDAVLYGDYNKFKKNQQRQSQEEAHQPQCGVSVPTNDHEMNGCEDAFQEAEALSDFPQPKQSQPPQESMGDCAPRQPQANSYTPTRGRVISRSAQVQVTTPILEVFESAYTAGREIRESFSQMIGSRKEKSGKASEQQKGTQESERPKETPEEH